ncbi:hypothetical protein TWF718_009332 [Orbilia javanica]|uniref:Uncharacterized protein n=1 Tax=Orbilia javanica TaxID=47235 RepID=A0AAN8MRI9_9PEZI
MSTDPTTPLTILLSPTHPSELRSQIEADLTTIRKRIRRAKRHSIPQTTMLTVIDNLKQIADIYATTAMAYVTASSTAELYAISAGALERLMRVEEELRKVDGIVGEGEYARRERRKEEYRRERRKEQGPVQREGASKPGRTRVESELGNTIRDSDLYQSYAEPSGTTSYNNTAATAATSSRDPTSSREPAGTNRLDKGKQRADYPNPYAEGTEGRVELMGVPDLSGRRMERYNLFQSGSTSYQNLEIKTVPTGKPVEKVVEPVTYHVERATPAGGRLVRKKRPDEIKK